MENAIEIFGQIFGMSLVRYFIIAGIPFLLFYHLFSGRLKKFKIQDRFAKKKDFVREIIHSSQTTIIFTLLAFVILYTPLKNYTLVYDNINDYPGWWITISVLLSLVVHDTYFYWMHRLLHHKKIYRHAHVVHHKSTNPSPWASYSFHYLEAIAEGLILLLIAVVMPLHPLAILLFTIAGFIINVYGHLGYEIAPRAFRKSFLFETLNTSTHHNLHHSRFNGNYGLYFRLWDRLMGTENPDYVKEFDRVLKKREEIMHQAPEKPKKNAA